MPISLLGFLLFVTGIILLILGIVKKQPAIVIIGLVCLFLSIAMLSLLLFAWPM